ncbi:hypothetical protein A0O28_0033030 [Trichoderma guizhouense]|uniref:CFEM domain-containing protein n=1 Tax=Trichoderma guizhouense TaxID=1491466 RepID=A0A1T3CM70_9HYPO|nr:hypothetical protein A0O28_0033030 [Trichoderma guizhouense]
MQGPPPLAQCLPGDRNSFFSSFLQDSPSSPLVLLDLPKLLLLHHHDLQAQNKRQALLVASPSPIVVCVVSRCISVSPRIQVDFFDNVTAKMKSVVIALCTLAAVTAAQGSANLAACGQTCATNMLSADKAEELGCKQNDLRCLCANKNFLYGLRDCSAAICPAEDARKVVDYGISICAGAGVSIQTSGGSSGGASHTGSASGSATGSATDGESTAATASASNPTTGTAGSSTGSDQASGKVSTILTTFTSDGETVTAGIPTTISSNLSNGGSISVSTFTATVTGSDGSAHLTTGQTTLTVGSGSVTVTASEATATGSAILTTVTSGSSTIVKTLTTVHRSTESDTASVTESTTQAESSSDSSSEPTETETSSSSSASSTSTSTAAGVPQKTAGPVGIIAAAGLAILML